MRPSRLLALLGVRLVVRALLSVLLVVCARLLMRLGGRMVVLVRLMRLGGWLRRDVCGVLAVLMWSRSRRDLVRRFRCVIGRSFLLTSRFCCWLTFRI